MEQAAFISTPKQYYPEEQEELLTKNEYKVKYNSDFITLMIGKTKSDIIIRSSYYEIKMNQENLFLLNKTKYNSIDESYEFLVSMFNQNKFRIKEKSSNIIKLIIKIDDKIKRKEKELELCLSENFNNKNILIKELFNKYMNIEKEINEIKNDNYVIKEENVKLRQENNNLKNEIKSINHSYNKDKEDFQIQIMNMMNQFQQQINQLINQINNINITVSEIMVNNLNNNYNLMNQNNYNNFNSMNNQNFMQLNENNNSINLMAPNVFELNQNKQSIQFKFYIEGQPEQPSIMVEFENDDLISILIEKFRIKANFFNQDAIFIYLAKRLYENLTVEESGINSAGTIFVFPNKTNYIFRIYGMKDLDFPFIIASYDKRKNISNLIDSFLSKSKLSPSEIINFIYKGKELDQKLTIKEIGLTHYSEIFVQIKKTLDYIKIFFKCSDNHFVDIECLIKEEVKSVLDRYRYKTSNENKYIEFLFNSKKLMNI